MTSRETIMGWLTEGLGKSNSHMIVVCDTFDWDDHPVYVKEGEDILERIGEYNKDMQKIEEIYNYKLDLMEQIKEIRAYNK